jgi:hypothetical protein
VSAALIACRYANRPGWPAGCGAFDLGHRERSAEAGVCCVVLAFADVGQQEPQAPSGGDWPDFAPSDGDIPGGAE